MPAALMIPIGNRFYDWKYESEPEPWLGGRRVYHARGKVLGGSSSINGMIFQRGNPLDFERWAADPGMERWDYAHCLPYFKRMEDCLAAPPEDPFRGHAGPLVLERGPATTPLFGAFFDAVQQAGYELTDDVNGYRQEGFAAFDRNVRRGRRLSASRAYLRPVLRRPNLEVVTRAMVSQLLIEGGRVVGVDYSRPGRRHERVAAGEVILCGGAFNSPQLLQLSGVGDAGRLRSVGVATRHDLPGVGEHLQDHLEVYVQHACTQPVSLNPSLQKWRWPWIGLQWMARRGPAASNHFEAGGFACSNDDVDYPNLMFHFLPIAVRYDGSGPTEGHGYQVHIGPMYSDARGSVRITSRHPQVKPALRFNYLSTEQDRREWVEAIRTRAADPRPAGVRRVRRRRAVAGTCCGDRRRDPRMGRQGCGDGSPPVVHVPDGHRRGVRRRPCDDAGPRVARAARRRRVGFPYITNGNIYAPVMMVAEKAADLILENTPLAPESVEFYRRTRRRASANSPTTTAIGPTTRRISSQPP